MTFFIICISIVVIQRIVELGIAKNHTKKMFSMGAVEFDSRGYRFIVLMHICFFVSLIFEFLFLSRDLNTYWNIFAVIFLIAQVLRYWAVKSLGIFWNTRIVILKGSRLVSSGPYKFLSHPNYIAVAVEIASLPLIFSCYITSLVFTVLNFLVLKRRIGIETNALKQI